MKEQIKKLPLFGILARFVYFRFFAPFRSFTGSDDYWKKRYRNGGNSGAGSYQKLAVFKAEVLNQLVRESRIESVIEFGCGDGNQLTLARYPLYTGFDISPEAITHCQSMFADEPAKTFRLVQDYSGETAEMTLSLDVIYHLVEDDIFTDYMLRLFSSSTRLVVIYASNTEQQSSMQAPHVRHRKFSDWIEQNCPDWRLLQHIPNRYPYKGVDTEGSFADFYIYGMTVS